MRIDDVHVPRQQQGERVRTDQLHRREATRASERANRAEPGDGSRSIQDEVALSPEARAVREVRKAAGELPEVRPERVESLRRLLDAGTYRVDARLLARKMLEHVGG